MKVTKADIENCMRDAMKELELYEGREPIVKFEPCRKFAKVGWEFAPSYLELKLSDKWRNMSVTDRSELRWVMLMVIAMALGHHIPRFIIDDEVKRLRTWIRAKKTEVGE